MSNRPFDSVVIQARERPLSSDVNTDSSEALRTQRTVLRALTRYRGSALTTTGGLTQSSFLADSFAVTPGLVGLSVNVVDGIGYQLAPGNTASAIGGVQGVDDLEDTKPLCLTAPKTITLTPADPVNPRIDIVEVRWRRALTDPSMRFILDPGTGTFVPALVDKNLEYCLDSITPSVNGAAEINVVTGVPAAVPVAPATSAGYVKLADVAVAALAAAVTGNNIIDRRKQLAPGGVRTVGVKAEFNTTTGAITNVIVTAPPSILVGLRGLLNFLGSGQPALQLLLFVPGVAPAGQLFSSHATVTQGRVGATPAEVLTPVIGNQFVLTGANVVTSLATGAPAAYWPNPSPALPVGAAVFESTVAVLAWNSLGPDWLGPLPNVVMSWVVEVPVG